MCSHRCGWLRTFAEEMAKSKDNLMPLFTVSSSTVSCVVIPDFPYPIYNDQYLPKPEWLITTAEGVNPANTETILELIGTNRVQEIVGLSRFFAIAFDLGTVISVGNSRIDWQATTQLEHSLEPSAPNNCLRFFTEKIAGDLLSSRRVVTRHRICLSSMIRESTEVWDGHFTDGIPE